MRVVNNILLKAIQMMIKMTMISSLIQIQTNTEPHHPHLMRRRRSLLRNLRSHQSPSL